MSSLGIVGNVFYKFYSFYNGINPATLTGAIDAIVVRQEDGSYNCSPFHVRFGKIGVLQSREKVVDIEINGEPVDIQMKLGESGEAFFVEELEEGDEIHQNLGTSPIPDSKQKRIEDDQRSQDSGVEAEDHGSKDNDKVQARCQASKKDSKESSIGEPYQLERQTNSVETKDEGLQIDLDEEIPFVYDGTSSQTNDNKPESNIKHNNKDAKTDPDNSVKSSTSSSVRRKRRRKNNGRRKSKTSGSHSSDNSTTTEVADVATLSTSGTVNPDSDLMFPMDDVVRAENQTENVAGSSIPSSSSMPLLYNQFENKMQESNWNMVMSRSMGPYTHPYSDTDISPPSTPNSTRPPTPIKSDTELEVQGRRDKVKSEGQSDSKWSWQWGELPTPPPNTTVSRKSSKCHNKEAVKLDNNTSNWGRVFSFMRLPKKGKHCPENEGEIYLDDIDINSIDPEVAAVYFPQIPLNFQPPEQNSLYNGFHPVGPRDDDVESGNGPSIPHSPHSVEGAIGGPKVYSDSESEDLRHPSFDFGGFHDLAFSTCGNLKEYLGGDFPETLFMQSLISYDDFSEFYSTIIKNPDLVIRLGGKYMNWETALPQIMSLVLFQRPLPKRVIGELHHEYMPKKETRKRSESKSFWFWKRGGEANEQETTDVKMEVDSKKSEEKSTNQTENSHSVCDAFTQTGFSDEFESDDERKMEVTHHERFKKSLRLTTDQIEKLNLQDGSNEVVFSVTTAYQGTTRCKCHIYLWNYDTKIVVSDIDGTITKSDVLGHILPKFGNDWAQNGVAELFTKIKNNGYEFLYLSARAIGQAAMTRDYLKSLKQDDLSLPDGPVLLNPTSLVNALHREVIEKKPQQFKISCLSDIKSLFPKNPFYAGYGNRVTDVMSYKSVQIPQERIFTINFEGKLSHELTHSFQSSYSNLCDYANHMFPPVHVDERLVEYSSLQYWKPTMPDVNEEIDLLFATKTKTKS